MVKYILLLGRTDIVVADAESQLDNSSVQVLTGTNIEDVQSHFARAAEAERNIEHVFMGAGIQLEKRLDIVKEVFMLSEKTTVHLKDAGSGPRGFLPFVKATLAGLEAEGL